MRLERFSGTKLNIDRDVAEIEGTPQQRALAKLAISITLQQRDGGAVAVDFDDLEKRDDVSTFDVPKETVGFLLGAKGSTLRTMETNHKVFMFFNNDRIRQGKSVSSLASLSPALPLPLFAGGRPPLAAACPLCFSSSSLAPSLEDRTLWHRACPSRPCLALARRQLWEGCPSLHTALPTSPHSQADQRPPHRLIGSWTAKLYAWRLLETPFHLACYSLPLSNATPFLSN